MSRLIWLLVAHIEAARRLLDFKSEEVLLDYQGEEPVLSMVSEYSQPQHQNEGTARADFTLDSDNDNHKSSSENKEDDEELVLAIKYNDLTDIQD